MCMGDVGVARGAPRSGRERDEERRQQEGQPRSRAQVLDDAAAVGDPEVAERRRRDDVDLVSRGAKVLDGLGDEAARDIVRRAGIARRQNADPHCREEAATSLVPAGRESEAAVRS